MAIHNDVTLLTPAALWFECFEHIIIFLVRNLVAMVYHKPDSTGLVSERIREFVAMVDVVIVVGVATNSSHRGHLRQRREQVANAAATPFA